jgi:hypothetical protein
VATQTDVTNQFYIDHNQNPDFYDQGYLYLQPSSTLDLQPSQGLIVIFDNFTNSSAGFFTKSSYVVDDNQTFANLNTITTGGSINTLEIPELYTSNGSFMDMIDCVDFRPRVVNTATITSNIALATANPAVNNANTKYGTLGPIGFPIDGSQYLSQATYYNGRTDLVIVNSNGQILDVTGNPGGSPPQQPSQSLIINYVTIPSYPSIPLQLDNNYTAILNKNIANKVILTNRQTTHTINSPTLSNTQLETNQPIGYTMADIGALEARIAALEYNVNLSQLEQSVSSLTIPSSISSSVNRFKYGFFADSFISTEYSATSDPEYSAQIVNNQVVPLTSTINIPFEFNLANGQTSNAVTGSFLTLPYQPYSLISQGVATNGAVVVASTPPSSSSGGGSSTPPPAPPAPPPPPVNYVGTLTANPSTFSITGYIVLSYNNYYYNPSTHTVTQA